MVIDLLLSAVICKFIEDHGNNMKSCTIAYGPGEACDNLISNHSLITDSTVTFDSVVINLPVLSQSRGMEYCYVVTASNGSFTAMVKGTFSTGNYNNIIITSYIYMRPVSYPIDLLLSRHYM